MTRDGHRLTPGHPGENTYSPGFLQRTLSRPLPTVGAAAKKSHRSRLVSVLTSIVALGLVVALANAQIFDGFGLAQAARDQHETTRTLHAMRGEILDASGTPLAYSREVRLLSYHPDSARTAFDTAHKEDPEHNGSADEEIAAVAHGIAEEIRDTGVTVDPDELIKRMTSDTSYVRLVRNVDPSTARHIVEKYPSVVAEYATVREYPGGALGSTVVGAVGEDGFGVIGLESSMESTLAGHDGSVTYDRTADGGTVPGSERDQSPAIDGSTVELTLDADAQYYVQQQIQQAAVKSGAKSARGVVLDAETGEVIAMANSGSFNPAENFATQDSAQFGNPSVSTPFEPGSVNKIITAAGTIEENKTTPDEVHTVDGSIEMSGVRVRDAWEHGALQLTTTGIFGKSSNVGTLQLVQRLGPEDFSDYLAKFGLGSRTDVGLPGESAGVVPPRNQWTAGTFANLPIGQGLSMTVLQMAGLYQTLANDGVRVPPRIVKEIRRPDGSIEQTPRPEGVRVVSPQTARTVRDMFRSVVQADPTGVNQGTGPGAAVEGYQISGKTGTAEVTDPACNCYSKSNYVITFAGIAPSDNPRYVIALMLDNPQRGVRGDGGKSAAPVFHDIASWLLTRDDVPPSPEAPRLILEK